MLANMHPHRLKMNHKAFGTRAPSGPSGGVYSALPDPLAGFKGAYF